MKKVIVALLVFCIFDLVGISVFAAELEKSPEKLYREYEAIVAEVNETYDLDIVLCPLEDMDQDHMSTVQGFRTDVNELVDAIRFIEKWQGGQEPEQGFFQGLFRRLFGPSEEERGVGAKTLSVNTPVYATAFGLDWTLSPIFVVNTPTGTPSYYIQDVRNADMTPSVLPTGYKAEANGSSWFELSPGKKQCTVYQQFTLSKNYVRAPVVPWVVFRVDTDTGAISVGELEMEE